MKAWKSLIVFLIVVFAVALIGATAKPDAWYAGLQKPAFNPPNWLFAPVWTILYIAMAIAAWRVYVRRGFDASLALWSLQLALNAAWSPLFFDLHAIPLALVDIALLLLAVAATAWLFFRRNRVAGGLMLPYAAWVALATLLTYSIWRLNPNGAA